MLLMDIRELRPPEGVSAINVQKYCSKCLTCHHQYTVILSLCHNDMRISRVQNFLSVLRLDSYPQGTLLK